MAKIRLCALAAALSLGIGTAGCQGNRYGFAGEIDSEKIVYYDWPNYLMLEDRLIVTRESGQKILYGITGSEYRDFPVITKFCLKKDASARLECKESQELDFPALQEAKSQVKKYLHKISKAKSNPKD